MVLDIEKKKARDKAYYYKNIEKKKAYNKAYRQTPTGKMNEKIGHWKEQGIHIEDMTILYKWYNEATHCEKCGVEFVDGKTNRLTKCVDHDHNLQFNNFRAFLCLSCNNVDKSSNTSGTPNIYYSKYGDGWVYSKEIKGKKKHTKFFKIKQEAIDYKKDYESSL